MSKFVKGVVAIISIVTIIGLVPIKAFANINNLDKVEENIYSHLENRDTNIKFLYTGDKKEFEKNIAKVIEAAYKKNDYIERSWVEITPTAKVVNGGIETDINITYLTDKNQEEYINAELKKESDLIFMNCKNDYDKVKAINEYLINRYEYDYTYKSVDIYSALTSGKTICQGYAMTAYKMLNYAGIENRIVVGSASGTSHSWNLIKLDGKWYHLDITNNDATKSNKYFLVTDKYLESNNYSWNKCEYPISMD
ncbi:transglutaminase domain-containing protein [Clostridium botulinum]|nr:transglutaminase-like domain-containing protein [Clostridium botulinum]MBY7009280.1 transglutaminase domain-containing protein [Clostridium botulinum]NFH74298.1 transglutaminase domain-containing protein [Clostridium botulinum]NFI02333.1 transglutaminase domain-containing protein [Clostridium botulinum]NFI57824.1 transglutaminase domain-containing protein [Clostridium botulinum]NFI64735.1 transglutaminase domain-containing protein [Clostridium botulinum]